MKLRNSAETPAMDLSMLYSWLNSWVSNQRMPAWVLIKIAYTEQ